MKILAIETSSKICGVAISENDKIIDEILIEDENTHSVKVMPTIDEILKKNKLELDDIELFTCDIGPGSFTGIRIGIATVKGFADFSNKYVYGVSSLENLAYNVKESGIICSLIDAKNNNVYFGLFEKKEEQIKAIENFKFDSIDNIITKLKEINDKIIFVGDGASNYKEKIIYELNENSIFKGDKENKLNAHNLAIIAYKNFNEGKNEIRPLYLRKSNAERLLEEKDGNIN